MYSFQSLHRNLDLGDKVRFRNFTYMTADKKLAEYVRRNCISQPHEIWETTPDVLLPATEVGVKEVESDKPQRGRPKKLGIVVGARSSDVAEGKSE